MIGPDCSQLGSDTVSLSYTRKYKHLNMDGWAFMYPVRVHGEYPVLVPGYMYRQRTVLCYVHALFYFGAYSRQLELSTATATGNIADGSELNLIVDFAPFAHRTCIYMYMDVQVGYLHEQPDYDKSLRPAQ